MTEPAEASPRQPVAVPDLSEADLRRLVDQGPFGYLACTPQGRIERVNATLLDWAGYERAELVGRRSFQELLAAGDRIYFDTHIRPLLHMGGGVRDIAVELVTAAGERLSVLITVDRIATAGPELVEILVVDARARRAYERELVEERRRAEHAQERLQLSYELVSGFASAATVEDVQRVVTATNASPFTGVRCHMWLFSDDMRSMLHAGPTETDVVTEEFDISGQQIGSAFDELSSGRLVEVSTDMAARYPMITGWLAGTELTTAIFAPLVEDDALIGTLGFGFVDDHEFDDDERRAVRSLAEQTSNALRRARLVEARERARRQLEHLHEFGRSLGAAVTVEEVIAALSAAGHDQFGALDVRIGRLDRDGRLIISGGRRDEPAPTVVQPSSAADVAVAALDRATDIVVATRAELSDEHPASASLSDPEVEQVMVVPLEDGERVVGSWVLGFAAVAIADEDRTLLRLFADEAAQAIRRAGMHEREASVRRRAVVRQSISEALNRAATIDAVAEALVVEGRNAFDADGLAVLVVDEREVSVARQIGLPPDHAATPAFPIDHPDIERLLDTGAPRFAEGAVAVGELLGELPFGRWRSAAALPLGLGNARANGLVIVLFRADDRLEVADRRALAGIAAEASVALGRAQMFDVEHTIAVTLQRSLLSEQVPSVEGWRIDPWYSPSNELLMVGGDLYDVVALPDGRFVIVVGDVVGHGLDAASSLGQLRSASRALALDRTRPAEMLDRLDRFAASTPGIRGATLCCAIIEPSGRGRYACAGHPYPVLVDADGATLLTEGRFPLLGYGGGARRDDAELMVEPGASLVLYTDGVVERPDESIDDGFERLRRVVRTIDFRNGEHPARAVGDAMMPGERRDDAVVVCVTRTG